MSKNLLCILVIIQLSLLCITNLFRKNHRTRILDNNISIFLLLLNSYQISTAVFKYRFLQSLTLDTTSHRRTTLSFGTIKMLSSPSPSLDVFICPTEFFHIVEWYFELTSTKHLKLTQYGWFQMKEIIFFNTQNVTEIKLNRLGKHKICRNNWSSSAFYLAVVRVLKYHVE